MSQILELVLCALVPFAISAFSAPREITPDDEVSAALEWTITDSEDAGGSAGAASDTGETGDMAHLA